MKTLSKPTNKSFSFVNFNNKKYFKEKCSIQRTDLPTLLANSFTILIFYITSGRNSYITFAHDF